MIINARTFLREYSYRRNVIFPETVTLEIGALFECTEKKISWEITILLINSTIFFCLESVVFQENIFRHLKMHPSGASFHWFFFFFTFSGKYMETVLVGF